MVKKKIHARSRIFFTTISFASFILPPQGPMMTTIQKEKENNKKQARRDATKRGIRKRPLMNGKKRERERENFTLAFAQVKKVLGMWADSLCLWVLKRNSGERGRGKASRRPTFFRRRRRKKIEGKTSLQYFSCGETLKTVASAFVVVLLLLLLLLYLCGCCYRHRASCLSLSLSPKSLFLKRKKERIWGETFDEHNLELLLDFFTIFQCVRECVCACVGLAV